MKDDNDNRPRDIFGELIPTTPDGASTSLTTFADELAQGLSNVSLSIASSGVGGGLPFLGLSRSGNWAFGAENNRVSPGAEGAVDLRSIKHGWVCWNDGKLLGEVMVSAGEKLPAARDLPDTGFGYDMAVSFEMIFVNGPDQGVKTLYKNSSLGGKKAVMGLLDAVRKQVKVDPSKPIPFIRLDAGSYDHKKYGEIFYPIFEIVRWSDGRTAAPVREAPMMKQEPPRGAPVTEAVHPDIAAAAAAGNAGRRRRTQA
jgi:hypothetical protein